MKNALLAVAGIAAVFTYLGLAKLFEITITALFNPPDDMPMTFAGFIAAAGTYVVSGAIIALSRIEGGS